VSSQPRQMSGRVPSRSTRRRQSQT
jgi:hypothetical protein